MLWIFTYINSFSGIKIISIIFNSIKLNWAFGICSFFIRWGKYILLAIKLQKIISACRRCQSQLLNRILHMCFYLWSWINNTLARYISVLLQILTSMRLSDSVRSRILLFRTELGLLDNLCCLLSSWALKLLLWLTSSKKLGISRNNLWFNGRCIWPIIWLDILLYF